MCTRIKLLNGKSYTPREVARSSFPNEKFNGFCRKENIETTWKDRIVNYFAMPILGYTERDAEGNPVEFNEKGQILFVRVESFIKSDEHEIRIVTMEANNGTMHGRKPVVLKQVPAQTSSN